MNNALRLGVATVALVLTDATATAIGSLDGKPGVQTQISSNQNSARDGVGSVLQPPFPGIDGLHYPPGTPIPTTYGYELNLIDDLKTLTLSNVDLLGQLDATRAQVEELLMRLDTMEQACEDTTVEDGTERDVIGEHHINTGGGGPFFFWQ